MKMVCHCTWEKSLTYGKIYECTYSDCEYTLINDDGEICSYLEYNFYTIREHREEQIDNLLEYDKILYWINWRNTF